MKKKFVDKNTFLFAKHLDGDHSEIEVSVFRTEKDETRISIVRVVTYGKYDNDNFRYCPLKSISKSELKKLIPVLQEITDRLQ